MKLKLLISAVSKENMTIPEMDIPHPQPWLNRKSLKNKAKKELKADRD